MVIGLCGRMGTGKSTALQIFESFGFDTIDCDDVSREVCQKGSPCLAELCDYFGSGILEADGGLNRLQLAKCAFVNKENTDKLNEITHRHILKRVRGFIKNSKNNCVIAAPLLFESGLDVDCDITLALTAPIDILFGRMNGRFEKEDFLSRINKQYSDEFLKTKCDFVIENDTTPEALKEKIILFIQCVSKK